MTFYLLCVPVLVGCLLSVLCCIVLCLSPRVCHFGIMTMMQIMARYFCSGYDWMDTLSANTCNSMEIAYTCNSMETAYKCNSMGVKQ